MGNRTTTAKPKNHGSAEKVKVEKVEVEKFNLKKVHADSLKRHNESEMRKKRGGSDHFQHEYEVDVEQSYAASMALLDKEAEDYQLQKAHIESVLAAGPIRY